MKIRPLLLTVPAVVLGTALSLHADVKTQERTLIRFEGALGRVINMFGGRSTRDGVVSSVAVKGDRMFTTIDQTAELVDLAEEKVYQIDLRRKQYTVATFAEVRKSMEEAMAKATADAEKQQGRKSEDGKEYEVDVDVKTTGQSKQIAGHDTKESVISITVREKGKTVEDGGMVMETSLWLANNAPQLAELNDFRMRYAQKLYGPMMAQAGQGMTQAMAMYPMMKDAMARFQAESGKLQGTPLSTVMKVQLAGTQAESGSSGNNEAPAVGGLLGGLGRRLGRRNNDDKKEETPAATPDAPGRTTVLTSTTETLQVAPTVADIDVTIPAGFQKR
ncbi:MAG: hypothetical protein IT178_13270 [Acidobacteria bacterium]|nr:hypothetical protein [Acidobacteriota bacterium]